MFPSTRVVSSCNRQEYLSNIFRAQKGKSKCTSLPNFRFFFSFVCVCVCKFIFCTYLHVCVQRRFIDFHEINDSLKISIFIFQYHILSPLFNLFGSHYAIFLICYVLLILDNFLRLKIRNFLIKRYQYEINLIQT